MSKIINQQNNNVKSSVPKVVFLGTPEFAVPILEKLAQSEYKPVAVFCAPDKLVGRKQILTPPPVKTAAQKYNIPVYQPANSRELAHTLKPIPYTLIISAAYGLILLKEVLDAPKFGCLNIHPSLLPKYRGPSPIQATILNGDKETGVTIIKMDEKIDHGAILTNDKLQITNAKITTPELSEKLAHLGADLLIKTLPVWLVGKITPQPQDESQATYTKIIKKEDGLIDWHKSAQEIERQIRAFTPWPGAYSNIKNQKPVPSRVEGSKIKIINAKAGSSNRDKTIGQIFLTQNNELAVKAGKDALIVKKLQIEGGKPMIVAEFLRGHQEIINKILI